MTYLVTYRIDYGKLENKVRYSTEFILKSKFTEEYLKERMASMWRRWEATSVAITFVKEIE